MITRQVKLEEPKTAKLEEPKTVKLEAPKTAKLETKPTVYTSDLGGGVGHRLSCSGTIETAPLQRGADGFLFSVFAGGCDRHSFDITNLTLNSLEQPEEPKEPKKHKEPKGGKKGRKGRKGKKGKGKKAKKAPKKPASPKKAPKKAAAPKKAPKKEGEPPKEGVAKNWTVMYYKNSHSIGIRETWGVKTQCFAFGGKRAVGKTKDEIKALGFEVLDMLRHGMSYEDAKTHALTRCD